ncbi:hypothetical protein RN346_04535 [Halomonas sp. PAMB 3232]|uniref:hypothetical protein n=1 Tax=Halomonas sp. PAMB 3232 TaxID=3075221 RepID=UPI00289A077A|nr:hypothetical protein [Halomonas sp. PAMB 3232]WNL39829.1 hypothetical protein RN346_04535 [Halomonas sp. PAMB 3232]
MTALTQNRNTPYRENISRSHPMAAGAVVYAGGIVAMAVTGFAAAAGPGNGLVAVGVATHFEDNKTGDNGDQHVEVKRGCFAFTGATGEDAIGPGDVGFFCFMVDDQTVAKTDGEGTRSVAGVIDGVDDFGVWVRIDPTNGPVASA